MGQARVELMLDGAKYEIMAEPHKIQSLVCFLAGDGHGHHFAVLGDGRVLALSGMAVGCLQIANLLDGVVATDG